MHRRMSEPGGAEKSRGKRRRASNGDRGLKPQHLLVGAGVGAALAYLYDSTTGETRRNYPREKRTVTEPRTLAER